MKKQKQIIFGMILLVSALLFGTVVNAQVFPCDDNYYALTYSPNDLNEGESFNLRFTDISGKIIGENVLLNYSGLDLISGSNPQTVVLVEDYGQAIWTLNSTTGGIYYVNVIVPMNSTQNCSLEKNITIYPYDDEELAPNLIVTMENWNTIQASNNYQTYTINYNNIGTGRALNITSFFNSISSINYLGNPFTLNAGQNADVDYNFNNSLCGLYNLSATTTYQNEIGEYMTPINSYELFNVSGSDIQILSVEITDSRVYEGEDVVFLVNVTNNNRTLNGIISANADNVLIYINNRVCSVPTDINIGDVKTISCSYHVENVVSTNTKTYSFKANSENECSNWANNEYNFDLTIYSTSTGGGSGGSSGSGSSDSSSHVPICGNKLCEYGETESTCPTDCLYTEKNLSDQNVVEQGINEIIIYSKDKLAFLKLNSGVKVFMENLPIKDIREWVIIENGNITKKLPYGVRMIRQYEFIPNGLEFIPSATIGFKYNDLEIRNGLYIMYYDEKNNKWIYVDHEIDKTNNVIQTSTTHFSNYALVTKEYFSLTGFYLIDSFVGFVNKNLWINLLAVGIILLGLFIFLFSLFKKKKK